MNPAEMMFTSVNTISGSNDPLFAQVKSLMHYDANFNDAVAGRTWVNDQGTVSITTSAIVGTGSMLFGAAKGSLKSTPFNPGTSNFCIEFKFKKITTPQTYCVLWEDTTSDGNYTWQIYTNGGSGILWSSATVGDHGNSSFAFVNNGNHEMAIDRFNGVVRVYLDGALVDTVTDTTNYSTAVSSRIGCDELGSYPATDWIIDETRLTMASRFSGAASYVPSYTPYLEG